MVQRVVAIFFLYYETNSYHVLSIKHIIVAKEELKSFEQSLFRGDSR